MIHPAHEGTVGSISISNALFLQEARYSWAREPSRIPVLGLEPGHCGAVHRPGGAMFRGVFASRAGTGRAVASGAEQDGIEESMPTYEYRAGWCPSETRRADGRAKKLLAVTATYPLISRSGRPRFRRSERWCLCAGELAQSATGGYRSFGPRRIVISAHTSAKAPPMAYGNRAAFGQSSLNPCGRSRPHAICVQGKRAMTIFRLAFQNRVALDVDQILAAHRLVTSKTVLPIVGRHCFLCFSSLVEGPAPAIAP